MRKGMKKKILKNIDLKPQDLHGKEKYILSGFYAVSFYSIPCNVVLGSTIFLHVDSCSCTSLFQY